MKKLLFVAGLVVIMFGVSPARAAADPPPDVKFTKWVFYNPSEDYKTVKVKVNYSVEDEYGVTVYEDFPDNLDVLPEVPREEGVYPDPEYKTRFYVVITGEGKRIIRRYQCPPYTVFCKKELRCEVPEKCDCYDKY